MKGVFKDALPLNRQCRHLWGGSRVLLLVFWLVTCPVSGQGKPTKVATKEDYHLWGNMYFENISGDGRWISYKMQYDLHPDTLVVQNTNSRVKYRFPDGDGKFYGEKWFVAKHGDTLALLDLATGKQKQLAGIFSYAISSDNRTLVTIEKDEESTRLCLSAPWGGMIEKIENVRAFSMAPTGDAIIFQKQGKVVWLPLVGSQPAWEIEGVSGECHFAWQENGTSFAFIEKGQQANVVFHAVPKGKVIHIFKAETAPGFPSGRQIAWGQLAQLTISGDGQKVFFGLLDPGEAATYDGREVKVWNGNDKFFYPQKNRNNNLAGWPKMAVWFPYEGRFLPLAGTERPYIFFNGSQDYAITYGPYEIGPQYIEHPKVNYYLASLATGNTKLWLAAQSSVVTDLSVSPNGKYAAYFKTGDWWVYDFLKDRHTNATNGQIPGLRCGGTSEDHAFGVAAWGPKDNSLLVYDASDIWEIGLNRNSIARLTNGAEAKMRFRIAYAPGGLLGRQNFDGNIAPMQDSKKGMLLKAVADTIQAYYFRDAKGRLTAIDSGARDLTGLIRPPKANTYVWQSETFNSPPEFRIKEIGDKGHRVIEQSNPHHKSFSWREPEVIRFRDSSGTGLKGILYYPAGYDPQRKYPMVVHIYQEQSYRLHRYGIPSLYNSDGYNVQHLTARGYFVFEPDIVSNGNEPGLAALDCVRSGVKAVLARDLVDQGRVALIGHSFGGYETNFIITQSNMFACAISGAGISDLQSYYLGISLWLGRPEIWRVENQQWDMKKPLFEDRRRYERNSPMAHVENITTPLFQWTGELDNNVNPMQATALYVALRRLDRQQVLVTYPKEKHALVNPGNQKDLAERIDDWLDYYLKKEPPASWIADGIN